MKRNTFIKLLVAFAAGLILCGIGAGVCVMEFASLEIVEANTETNSASKEYTLPENEKLFIDDRHDTEIIADTAIEAGKMRIDLEYNGRADVDFGTIKNMYLCEASYSDDEFDEEYDVDFENTEHGEKITRVSVKGLNIPGYSYSTDDAYNLRQFMEHLKNKEIYVPNNILPKMKIYYNPADEGRIVCLGQYDKEVWLEEGSIIDDITNEVQPADIPSETTTYITTETTTSAK